MKKKLLGVCLFVFIGAGGLVNSTKAVSQPTFPSYVTVYVLKYNFNSQGCSTYRYFQTTGDRAMFLAVSSPGAWSIPAAPNDQGSVIPLYSKPYPGFEITSCPGQL